MTKRKCIFTGEDSDWLLQIGEDKHNWAKRVPCTRKWWETNKDRPLTPNEFKLVELFFEQEIARLKVDNLETEMQKIRDGRVTIVSAEEWDKLQEYLANPPEPTPALVEAMKRYKKEIVKEIELSTGVPTPCEEMTRNFKKVAVESGVADKLYNKELVLEVNGETIEAVQKVAYEYEPTIIDEPKDLKKEDIEKILEEPLKIPENAEVKVLTTPKNNDNIKKTVVKKKKPTLWD
jgi:hypothetical protein